MPVRDWPKPARLAAQWTLIALCIALAFLPASFLIWTANATADEPVSWSRLLGGYSLLVTIPATFVVAVFVALEMQKNPTRRSFGFSIAMGTTLGLVVGLVLTLITGGYSLLSAPPIGFLTFFVAWIIRVIGTRRGQRIGVAKGEFNVPDPDKAADAVIAETFLKPKE
jgi:Ca2+/Na+ antiporter